MFEIAVHHDDGVPARVAHPGAQRRLVPEVARERDIADRGIARGRTDRRERAVGRAVVDEHDLVGTGERHGLRDRCRDG
jgi:hypothetical protein